MEVIDYWKKSAYGDAVEEDRKKWADGVKVGDVETLLLSCKVKVLHCGVGGRVPTLSSLGGKDVGLYFLPYTEIIEFDGIMDMYMALSNRLRNFQLVFICLRLGIPLNSYEDKFKKKFQGMTWLASPYYHWKANRKLYDKFCLLCDPYYGAKFVFIPSAENIAHTYAWDIYHEFGFEAYPFSKSKVTEIEVASLKSLTLNSLCSPKDYVLIRGKDGQQIEVPVEDHLTGKNIIFFLTTEPDDYSAGGRRDKLIYQNVIGWYFEMKQKVPAFEMVRVVYNFKDNKRFRMAGESCIGEMPWLEFPCEMEDVYRKLFRMEPYMSYDYLPVFVAFGRDGKFISMTSLDKFVDSGKIDNCLRFFEDGHLYGEVRDYIASCKRWSTVNEETGECYIPV